MTRIALFSVFMACFSVLFAQVEEHSSVLVSAGGFESMDVQTVDKITYSMSWIIGESINETFVGSKKQLTQGFLQAQPLAVSSDTTLKDTVSNEQGAGEFAYQIKLYPNPVAHSLYIMVERPENEVFTLELSDLQGHKLQSIEKRSMSSVFNMDVSAYKGGMYILRVYTHSDKKNKIFRIIKIS